MKVALTEGLEADDVSALREEVAIHSTLDHPHVCKLWHAEESPDAWTLVLALCDGGSLVDSLSEAFENGRSGVGKGELKEKQCALGAWRRASRDLP